MATLPNTDQEIKVQIKKELSSYLDSLSHSELRSTSRKHCRSYLEQRLGTSLKKYKEYIKSSLIEYLKRNHGKKTKQSLPKQAKPNGHTKEDDNKRPRKRKMETVGGGRCESQPPNKKFKTADGKADSKELEDSIDGRKDSQRVLPRDPDHAKVSEMKKGHSSSSSYSLQKSKSMIQHSSDSTHTAPATNGQTSKSIKPEVVPNGVHEKRENRGFKIMEPINNTNTNSNTNINSTEKTTLITTNHEHGQHSSSNSLSLECKQNGPTMAVSKEIPSSSSVESVNGIATSLKKCSINGASIKRHDESKVPNGSNQNIVDQQHIANGHHEVKLTKIETDKKEEVAHSKPKEDRKSKKVKEGVLKAPPYEKVHPMAELQEMTELLAVNNLMAELNEKMTSKDTAKPVEMNWDGIEEQTLKIKLTKYQAESAKYKKLVKQYAGMLRPKELECQELRKQNETLQKKMDTLNTNFMKRIDELTNMLKNETENVKEERYKSLRKDKYVQRLQRKYDFVCSQYNIDPDVVVIQMGTKQCS